MCHATGEFYDLTQIMVCQARDYNFLKNAGQPLCTPKLANGIAGLKRMSLPRLQQKFTHLCTNLERTGLDIKRCTRAF